MKILVLSPHPDDIELAAGATLTKWSKHKITCVTFAFPDVSIIKTEQKGALAVLGITEQVNYDWKIRELPKHRQAVLDVLLELKVIYRPDLVLCPNPNDVHQDHQTIHDESLRAFKDCSIYGYDSPWNNYKSENRMFVVVDRMNFDIKMKALACYKSQNHRRYITEDYQKGLLTQNGAKINEEFAECFNIIRWID